MVRLDSAPNKPDSGRRQSGHKPRYGASGHTSHTNPHPIRLTPFASLVSSRRPCMVHAVYLARLTPFGAGLAFLFPDITQTGGIFRLSRLGGAASAIRQKPHIRLTQVARLQRKQTGGEG